uniref:Uncharacterized protein n=1 Tax=Gouania willdenowi TaxID=441366 RepID=A0A8C5FZJ0_GOUWI
QDETSQRHKHARWDLVPQHHWHGLRRRTSWRKLQKGTIFRNAVLKVLPVVSASTKMIVKCNMHYIHTAGLNAQFGLGVRTECNPEACTEEVLRWHMTPQAHMVFTK